MLKIKLFQQTKGFCGPSSLRMILGFYGIKKTEKEVAGIIGETREGCSTDKVVSAIKKLGFKVEYKVGSSIAELQKITDKGIPVIIYWTRHGGGHFSVVYGVKNNRVYIADPRLKRKTSLDVKTFLPIWDDPDTEDEREMIAVIKI
jgi:ABC-type bacteriocin/lantibiotic exporter with double-glycine peptidase domain